MDYMFAYIYIEIEADTTYIAKPYIYTLTHHRD